MTDTDPIIDCYWQFYSQ